MPLKHVGGLGAFCTPRTVFRNKLTLWFFLHILYFFLYTGFQAKSFGNIVYFVSVLWVSEYIICVYLGPYFWGERKCEKVEYFERRYRVYVMNKNVVFQHSCLGNVMLVAGLPTLHQLSMTSSFSCASSINHIHNQLPATENFVILYLIPIQNGFLFTKLLFNLNISHKR